jgi:hypothetical protein
MTVRTSRNGTFPAYIDHYTATTEAELLAIVCPVERGTGYAEDTQQNYTWTASGWVTSPTATPISH